MKKFPYPDKVLTTKEQIRTHIEDLTENAMNYLKVCGYTFHASIPGNASFQKHQDAFLSISMIYPYKKFVISVQQQCLSELIDAPLKSAIWENTERSVFHEIIHIILWRGTELAQTRFVTPTDIENENEFTTDHLANVIHPLVEELRKAKKNHAK